MVTGMLLMVPISPSYSLFPNRYSPIFPSSSSNSFILLQSRSSSSSRRRTNNKSSNNFPTLDDFRSTSCSSSSHRLQIQDQSEDNSIKNKLKSKKKQKLKPSFYHQVQQRWCLKTGSQRVKFPWQQQGEEEEELDDDSDEEEEQVQHPSSSSLSSSEEKEENSNYPLLGNRLISPPWSHRKPPTLGFESQEKISNGFKACPISQPGLDVVQEQEEDEGEEEEENEEDEGEEEEEEEEDGVLGILETTTTTSASTTAHVEEAQLPWDSDKFKKRSSNSELAEKMIPEAELRRLRNVSLRMKERIKVGVAGVTQALVDTIHQKWKEDEVVKMKFRGPPAFNMKRTHDTLESRTGGIVIWRSGSLLVLYRGMAYKLPCVKSYTKLIQTNVNSTSSSKDLATDVVGNGRENDTARTEESCVTKSSKPSDYPSEELMDIHELNNLLDGLGPRFKDWSGREPQPVDADLLPSVVPGYATPFRLLPHGTRPSLGNKRTTMYRRLARVSPPHFALGRNRGLQGLAAAMVKLWKKNALAKIAIKRGVQNTSNERMAEELKKLTGGTLLSRNVDYIVFYRGNDFLTPSITKALVEREKLAELRLDEEEQARQKASTFLSNAINTKVPLVAGTLGETIAANSRWGTQPSSKDLEKMKRDFVVAKQASLVTYLEKKLARAQDKVNRAEKELGKVQQFLKPTDLPSDLETISEEERFLFRKVGLSMKPFLLVGRSEVFDGTVENMHLHWKHRELVKVIVRGKNFPQVKHIAISLEAESGGVLISVDKTTKGHVIVFYRGKNYQRPSMIRPKNLLTKRQALARSIELQRREGLIHHISDLRGKIELLKDELDLMQADNETVDVESE